MDKHIDEIVTKVTTILFLIDRCMQKAAPNN
jgi:hypothetical protein